MASRSSQLIVVLVAVLLAVIAGSIVVLWVANTNQSDEVAAPVVDEVVVTPPSDSTATPGEPERDATFNTTILRSSSYTTLDQQLVTDGSLPVQPPAVVGKANPFL